jgi:hypothetical protein
MAVALADILKVGENPILWILSDSINFLLSD